MRLKSFFPAVGSVIAMAAAGMAFSSAQAATLTVSADIVSDFSNGTASVKKFDTALGTLNFVTIDYDLQARLNVFYNNSGTTTQTATIDSNVLSVRGHLPNAFITTENRLLATNAIGGDFEIPSGFDTEVINLGFSSQDSFDSHEISFGVLTPVFDINRYAGDGNFDFDFTAVLDQPLSFSGLLPITNSISPSIGGTVSVTYDFTEAVTAVPVPAALPLLATALGVFGFIALRRKKVA